MFDVGYRQFQFPNFFAVASESEKNCLWAVFFLQLDFFLYFGTKISKMSTKKSKMEALVTDAIRRLQRTQGTKPSEIADYLNKEYGVKGAEAKKQIALTLKRGVNYGLLQKSKRWEELQRLILSFLQGCHLSFSRNSVKKKKNKIDLLTEAPDKLFLKSSKTNLLRSKFHTFFFFGVPFEKFFHKTVKKLFEHFFTLVVS